MKKTIYLHVGTHKTGSTALQNFCALNLELLKKNDIDYLIQDTIWNGHHYLGWAFRGNTVALEQYCEFNDIGILNHLSNSVEQSGCNNFLLSSENLFLMDDEIFAKKFFEKFKDYEFKVIVYLREQSEFLESWYYELVRADYCCLTEEFDEYLEHPRYDVDYFKILTKWMHYVDRDDIKVISYSEIKKNNSLYSSFLHSLGIFNVDDFKCPVSTNERVSYLQLLQIKEINKKDLDVQTRNEMVRDVINNQKLQTSNNHSLFTETSKINTINKYYESNIKLFDAFGVKLSADDFNEDLGKDINLVIHIGMGKTGSSSIQKSLILNDEILSDQGVKYMGLFLENANLKKFDWQKPNNMGALFSCDEDYINDSIYEILLNEINYCKKKNINTIIWSNESLFRWFGSVSQALTKLREEKNVNLKIVIYFREHISWIKSAYKQWGIKHKQYDGKIQKFKDWYYWMKPPRYYKALKPVIDKFHDELIVRNMTTKNDVVKDFFEVCEINQVGVKSYRENDSPTNEELFFRALFNNKFNAPVLPNVFDDIIGKNVSFKNTIKTYLSGLFPTREQLVQLYDSIEDDRIKINELLSLYKEKGFVKANCENDFDLNMEKITFAISELVIEHSLQIDAMQQQINTFNDNDHQKNSNSYKFDDKKINLLRDVALMIEGKDIQKAYEVMSIASQLRPDGPYIAKKLEEYKEKLK